MRTVRLGNAEYGIRCDLNAVEAIEDRFGSVKDAFGDCSISATKKIAEILINEHFYYVGESKRITAEYVGAQIANVAEYTALMTALMEEIADCVTPKKV